MKYYQWSVEKNRQLQAERGISFEQVIRHINQGDILEILEHPNPRRYPNQQILVVNIEDYAYLVPFVEHEDERFLKTIIPSRKATRNYLKELEE